MVPIVMLNKDVQLATKSNKKVQKIVRFQNMYYMFNQSKKIGRYVNPKSEKILLLAVHCWFEC